MNPIIVIEPWQLAIALVFVLLAGGASLMDGLGLGRDLAVGTIRTFAQLGIMGYALKFIFHLDSAWLVVLVFLAMTGAAAHTIIGRVREKRIPYAVPMFLTMAGGYFLISVMVTGAVIQAEPWWKPQYFIPISGMVIGNSMTALAISLERLFSGLRNGRTLIEAKLALGADDVEATREVVRDAVKAGMIPTINSMMAVGLVFLPGMMTGQILSGTDPMTAIRYQIVVMLMLAGSTALGSVVVIRLARKRCFGPGMRLILGPERKGR